MAGGEGERCSEGSANVAACCKTSQNTPSLTRRRRGVRGGERRGTSNYRRCYWEPEGTSKTQDGTPSAHRKRGGRG